VLLEDTPEGFDPAELLAAVTDVNGVEAAHDLHVWTISSAVRALSVHIVVEGHPSLEDAQRVAGRVRAEVAHKFRISHATIELECESCEDLGPSCDLDMVTPGVAVHGHGH